MTRKLGSLEASEDLISELYVDLRRRINIWAAVTKQTAQARMGYVGQHLVSIVTGFPGGRSGARGRDLIISPNEYGEIKTCYRVDQLGRCNVCGAATAAIEGSCADCGSEDIKRNDDSKWLISIKHEDDYCSILDPKVYYFVLFDFVNMEIPDTIRASIWEVNPVQPGFAYCIIDYYENIRSLSRSKAPFNLWPFHLKFQLMSPALIYRSFINADDSIRTEVFPGRDAPVAIESINLAEYRRSRTLTRDSLSECAQKLGVDVPSSAGKASLIAAIDEHIKNSSISTQDALRTLATSIYWPLIARHMPSLPTRLFERLRSNRLIENPF